MGVGSLNVGKVAALSVGSQRIDQEPWHRCNCLQL